MSVNVKCLCMCMCHVLECVAPFICASSPLILISLLIQVVNEDTDSQAEGEGGRPSLDLFKAIFASSSDEKSSSSEDERGDSEDDQEGTGEADFRSSQETGLTDASSVAQGMSNISDFGI